MENKKIIIVNSEELTNKIDKLNNTKITLDKLRNPYKKLDDIAKNPLEDSLDNNFKKNDIPNCSENYESLYDPLSAIRKEADEKHNEMVGAIKKLESTIENISNKNEVNSEDNKKTQTSIKKLNYIMAIVGIIALYPILEAIALKIVQLVLR